VLAAAWVLTLFSLAWWTANPVTLNYRQIADSEFVVSGTVVDVQAGRVDVDREWKRGEALQDVVVENLSGSGAAAGERYLIPLARGRGDGFEITETLIEDGKPLIYPATQEATSQLETILEALHTRDADQ
jgi:hypothetical protein